MTDPLETTRIGPARRLFILGAAATPFVLGLPAAAMAAVPASGRLSFHAIRLGKKIGEHHMTFAVSGDAVTVHTDVAMTASIGPFTLNYAHHATERWRGDQFESLDSHTSANGFTDKVSARRTGANVLIDSAKSGHVVASAAVAPLTHWNMAAMRAPLFNPQTGKMLKVSAARSPGRIVIAGEAELTDFYDASGVWSGLKGKVKDGSILEYRRV